jgi:ribonuclease-3
MTNIDNLKKLFKNKDLFDQALTHKSWVNENQNLRESNERLEFLGDAILEFIVSKELFNKFPEEEEGFLTTLRANLVNTQNLSRVAKKMNIGEALYLSHGEEEGGGRKNTSLLANTIEAVIGALFLDQGLDKVCKFIEENLLIEIADKIKEPLKDAKSRLQECVQAKGLPVPKYKVVKDSGPDHSKKFIIEAVIGGKTLGRGMGKNKSTAAQIAAKDALKHLDTKDLMPDTLKHD